MHRRLISVVIPAFNEERNVFRTYEAVKAAFAPMADNYDFEIIFTDNHSTDETFKNLKALAQRDPRVKVARFTRNYGFNKSLLTGYRLAKGEAAIQLDCDLQDPPEMFSSFLREWEKGHDVVVGVRRKRDESSWLQLGRKAFYRFLSQISDDNLVIDGGDFRLVDRSILDQLKVIHDSTPYVRGLVSTLATNQISIPYDRASRQHDNSKFPIRRLIWFAIDGVVSHSTLPLRLASLFGFLISILTLALAATYLVGKVLFQLDWPAGFTTQVMLILFGISLNAIFLGIIGEYISRIYLQLRQRPLTVVESSINLTESGSSKDLKETGANVEQSRATLTGV